jgi:hypothetical protein
MCQGMNLILAHSLIREGLRCSNGEAGSNFSEVKDFYDDYPT